MRVIRIAVVLFLAAVAARAADVYKIDPAHTTIGFSISHLVISEVNGWFNDFDGEVMVDGEKVTGAKTTIQAKSINTRIEKRDNHLRSPDFFDAEKNPTITFESTKVETEGDKNLITGKFTMHGVTKEIRFPFVSKGPIKDPWGNIRIGLKAETTVKRTDYGMKPFKGVGDEVEIRINAEAAKPLDEKK